jgi:CRISPR-associated protein Cas2
MPHYLICYDIANPKRLGRVHRRTVKHALFVQYSIYYLEGDRLNLQALLDDLRDVIDEKEDDVRAYTVSPISDAIQIGRSWLPEELILL